MAWIRDESEAPSGFTVELVEVVSWNEFHPKELRDHAFAERCRRLTEAINESLRACGPEFEAVGIYRGLLDVALKTEKVLTP